MNIKVVYRHPNFGYSLEREHIAKWLVLGNEYTVRKIDRGGWHTTFELEEAPGQHFNSVHFEEVVEGSLAAAYAEIPSDYITFKDPDRRTSTFE